MKRCTSCNVLFDESIASCPQCGRTDLQLVEIVEVVKEPITEEQPQPEPTSQNVVTQAPMIAEQLKVTSETLEQESPLDKLGLNKESFQKLLKDKKSVLALSVLIILVVVASIVIFSNAGNNKLSTPADKQVNLNSPTNTQKPSGNNNPTPPLNNDDPLANLNFPENTYQKVYQDYIYSIPKQFETIEIEQEGLSLLNTATGESIWISVSKSSLPEYVAKENQLRQIFESQNRKVISNFQTSYGNVPVLVLEIEDNQVKTLLAIIAASQTESHLITISNSSDPTNYQYETLNSIGIELAKTAINKKTFNE